MCTYDSELEKQDLTLPCSLTARGAITSSKAIIASPFPLAGSPGLPASECPCCCKTVSVATG